MRGLSINAGLAGMRSKLSFEVAKLLRDQDWWSAGAPKGRPRPQRRALLIEPLESRHLMDAAGLASLVSSIWFESIANADQIEHAGAAMWTAQDTIISSTESAVSTTGDSNLYDWIIQFDTASLSSVGSVAQTANLLTGGGVEFQIIEGLGMVGLVLARSSGASLDVVEDWLSSNVYVSAFEQDAVRQFDVSSGESDEVEADATSNDPKLASLWGMSTIDAQEAWNISTGSSSVIVAVLDTGVDYTHSDLAANIWVNPGEVAGNGIDDDGNGFVDDLYGYDFANNDGDPMDDNGHGTHVSGTIAAVGNNAKGVVGVNWNCSIMSLKFLGGDGTGYLSDAVRAINYATMMRTTYGVNIRVENNSWGGGSFSTTMQNALEANAAAGILFVVAAGNSGANNDTTAQYPANYTSDNVLVVAASTRSDTLASFSNYGVKTVDIAAPGVSIYSTIPGNKYATYSGTSMATPFVSGVAALAWAVNPNATVEEVTNAILEGADSVSSLSGKLVSGGRLNAYNTLQLIDESVQHEPTVDSLVASPGSIESGAAVTMTVQGISNSSGAVAAVYVYQDSNNNGQYDSSDAVVGSTTTISGMTASVTIDTTGLAEGVYRYFARIVDNDSLWSNAVATTLTVLPKQNSAPVLASIADQTMPTGQTTLKVAISATDADGDQLTYTTKVLTIDAFAEKAYSLDQKLGLYQWRGTYYTNLLGKQEKYMRASNGAWYFILPDGSLHRWGGNIARSTLVDTFSSAYYANPSLLHDAQPATYTAANSANVSVSVSGNTLTIRRAAGFTSDFYVYLTVSDGSAAATKSFHVSTQSTAATRMTALAEAGWSSSVQISSVSVPSDVQDASASTPDPITVRTATNWLMSRSLQQAANWNSNASLLHSASSTLVAPCGIEDAEPRTTLLTSSTAFDRASNTLADSMGGEMAARRSTWNDKDAAISVPLSAAAIDSLFSGDDLDARQPWDEISNRIDAVAEFFERLADTTAEQADPIDLCLAS